MCEAGCSTLSCIANASDAFRAACVASGAPAAVVVALTTHAGVAAVCERGAPAASEGASRVGLLELHYH